MAPAIKNRLVGTIIIFALAVIFLPDILDGEKQTRRDIIVNIPISPEQVSLQEPQSFSVQEVKLKTIKPVVVEQNVNPIDEALSETDNLSAPTDISPVDNSEVAQAGDSKTNPKNTLEQQTFIQQPNAEEATGWVIQLGSFKHQKNVRELMDNVEKAGYRVFSKPFDTSVGKLNKVFVGPDLDKSKLEKSLSHLQEVTGLTGRVTPFTVK